MHSTDTYLYVDDTAILKGGTDIAGTVAALESEIIRANMWLKDHNLSRMVSSLSDAIPLFINLEGIEIKCVDQYKYLGIMLDDNLRFDKHAKYLESALWPKVEPLARIQRYMNKDISLYIHSALIAP